MTITLTAIFDELNVLLRFINGCTSKDSNWNLRFIGNRYTTFITNLEKYDDYYENEDDDWCVHQGLNLIRDTRKTLIEIVEHNQFIPSDLAVARWIPFLLEYEAVYRLIEVKLQDPSSFFKIVYINNKLPIVVRIGYKNSLMNREDEFYIYPDCTFTIMAHSEHVNFYIKSTNNQNDFLNFSVLIPEDMNTPMYALKIVNNKVDVILNKYSL